MSEWLYQRMIAVRFTEDQFAALERIAAAEDRTVAQQVRRAVKLMIDADSTDSQGEPS